jgi:thymidylate kinase
MLGQPAARRLAPLVAIVGPDGAGKTTTAHYLCSVIANSQYAYLGLGSGALGLKIRRWPLLGPLLERYLSAKARRARTPGERIPGPVTAAVIYLFGRLRRRRFLHMLQVREGGQMVICDRYPQAQIPGLNDGPGLSVARATSWLTAWLARRERDLYTEMAHIPPTLVIRLNVDARTAWARKPDHDLALIERKVAACAALKFAGARVVEVDARLPQSQVQALCRQLIERHLGELAGYCSTFEHQVARVE